MIHVFSFFWLMPFMKRSDALKNSNLEFKAKHLSPTKQINIYICILYYFIPILNEKTWKAKSLFKIYSDKLNLFPPFLGGFKNIHKIPKKKKQICIPGTASCISKLRISCCLRVSAISSRASCSCCAARRSAERSDCWRAATWRNPMEIPWKNGGRLMDFPWKSMNHGNLVEKYVKWLKMVIQLDPTS